MVKESTPEIVQTLPFDLSVERHGGNGSLLKVCGTEMRPLDSGVATVIVPSLYTKWDLLPFFPDLLEHGDVYVLDRPDDSYPVDAITSAAVADLRELQAHDGKRLNVVSASLGTMTAIDLLSQVPFENAVLMGPIKWGALQSGIKGRVGRTAFARALNHLKSSPDGFRASVAQQVRKRLGHQWEEKTLALAVGRPVEEYRAAMDFLQCEFDSMRLEGLLARTSAAQSYLAGEIQPPGVVFPNTNINILLAKREYRGGIIMDREDVSGAFGANRHVRIMPGTHCDYYSHPVEYRDAILQALGFVS